MVHPHHDKKPPTCNDRIAEVQRSPSPIGAGRPFLWSKRFDASPECNSAQRHVMYKKYYGLQGAADSSQHQQETPSQEEEDSFARSKRLIEEKLRRRSPSASPAVQRRSKSIPSADHPTSSSVKDRTRCLSPLVLSGAAPYKKPDGACS